MKSLYKVFVKESVQRQIRSLPKKEVPAILDTIRLLAENPRPHNCKKLIGTLDQYRAREADYRIIYTIDDKSKEVTIFRVRHRREAYR